MKKSGALLILVILLSTFVNAFAFSELFNGYLNNLVTGSAVRNNPPTININFPVNNVVLSVNPVEFNWKYIDKENDLMVAYEIQISDNFNFGSSQNQYGASGSFVKLRLDKGDVFYYWRMRAKDDFDWGPWSESGMFVLDTSVKVCEDGTKFWECSEKTPYLCDGGLLKENCSECGCPVSSRCMPTGKCQSLTCFDGTLFGSCSNNNPMFCQDGTLKEVCSLCGCPEGSECKSDGTCSKTTIVIIDSEEIKDITLLESIVLFFKNLF